VAEKTTERPVLLTQQQAREILGLSRETMRRVIAAGAIEKVWVAGLGRPRYRRGDIEALIQENRAP
jgi:predicted site-specific integrase-resolvase